MSKLLSFIFISTFSPFLPAFFFFIGVKLHYIDSYGITEFYNIIFVDKISWDFFWTIGLVRALLFISPFKKLAGSLLILLTLGSMFMLISFIGHDVSYTLFAKKDFNIVKKPWRYSGVLLYEGRKNYYLLSDETKEMITFNKDKIDEAY